MSAHSHAHGPALATDQAHKRNENRTLLAFLLTGAFMGLEVAGGLLTGSLALLADAAHMLIDTSAMGMAWIAFRLSRRPADTARTYGFHRVQVLAAFINGLTLAALALWIVAEAVSRARAPEPVLAGPMLGVALAGLAVNILVFRLLAGADRNNLNIAGAMAHVMGDVLGSLAAIAAAIVILQTGWMPIDPLLSLLVAGVLIVTAIRLIVRSGNILLEGAPPGLDAVALQADLLAHVPGLSDIHHLHIWSLTRERPMITLHARLREGHAADSMLARLKHRLRETHGLDHSTIQLETGPCPDGPDPANEGIVRPPAERA